MGRMVRYHKNTGNLIVLGLNVPTRHPMLPMRRLFGVLAVLVGAAVADRLVSVATKTTNGGFQYRLRTGSLLPLDGEVTRVVFGVVCAAIHAAAPGARKVATVFFNDTIHLNGWSFLELHSNAAFADEDQAYVRWLNAAFRFRCG